MFESFFHLRFCAYDLSFWAFLLAFFLQLPNSKGSLNCFPSCISPILFFFFFFLYHSSFFSILSIFCPCFCRSFLRCLIISELHCTKGEDKLSKMNACYLGIIYDTSAHQCNNNTWANCCIESRGKMLKRNVKVVWFSVIQPVVHESLLVHELLYNGPWNNCSMPQACTCSPTLSRIVYKYMGSNCSQPDCPGLIKMFIAVQFWTYSSSIVLPKYYISLFSTSVVLILS